MRDSSGWNLSGKVIESDASLRLAIETDRTKHENFSKSISITFQPQSHAIMNFHRMQNLITANA